MLHDVRHLIHLADTFIQSLIQILHLESTAEYQEVHRYTVFWVLRVKEQPVLKLRLC